MNEQKPLSERLSEPILNAKQVFAIMVTLLYEVISNLLVYALMKDPNWTFIIVNVAIGIIIIVGMALLRSAFPQEIPDKTVWSAFWSIWQQVVDLVTDPNPIDPKLRMDAFEKFIQWTVREWDIAYEEKLHDQIAYYRERQNNKIECLEKEKAELEAEISQP